MKNIFKQVLQVILRVYVIKLTAFYQREDECRVFCCTLTLMFIQFLSSSFIGFILCLQRLFDISAELSYSDFSIANLSRLRLFSGLLCPEGTVETVFPAVLKLKPKNLVCQHPIYLILHFRTFSHKPYSFLIVRSCCR